MVLTLQANESPQNAISSNLKPTRKKTLEEVFNQLDEDGTGSISPAEIKRGFQKLCRIKVSDKVIEYIMKKTDLDGNGTIELDELEFLMETYEIEKSFNLRGDVKHQHKPHIDNNAKQAQFAAAKSMTDVEAEHEKRLADLEKEMR